MPKILFYIERNLHLPYLLPIHAELIKVPGMETGFCAPPFVPTTAHSPGWGLRPETVRKLGKIAPFYSSPGNFSPDVTVIADACHFRLPRDCGPTVNVGHGLICKGTFYTPSSVSRRENLSTVLCVPGPWHKKRIEPQVKIPIEVTGFIKMDELITSHIPDKKSFFQKQSLPEEGHHVLFAPTFNPELSSIPFVIPVLKNLASSDSSVSIKLHAMTPPQWVDACRQLARTHEQIAMLDEDDYAPMMHHCDLMLSDVSSIFVEFMLLDKPVVLFSRPDIGRFKKFDPSDIEYQVRKGCSEVTRPSALPETIHKELEHPDAKSQVRQSFCKALDYGRDGESARRAAQVVLDTLDSRTGSKKQSQEKFLLIIDGTSSSRDQVEKTLQRAQVAGVEQYMEIYCCQEGKQKKESPFCFVDMRKLRSIIETNTSQYVVFLQAGWSVPYNWAKHMALHLKWEPGSRLVRGLVQKPIADKVLQELEFHNAKDMTSIETAHYSRTMAIGGTGIGICGKTPCVLAPLAWARTLLEQNKPDSIQELSALLHATVRDREAATLTALDVFLYQEDTVTAVPPRY